MSREQEVKVAAKSLQSLLLTDWKASSITRAVMSESREIAFAATKGNIASFANISNSEMFHEKISAYLKSAKHVEVCLGNLSTEQVRVLFNVIEQKKGALLNLHLDASWRGDNCIRHSLDSLLPGLTNLSENGNDKLKINLDLRRATLSDSEIEGLVGLCERMNSRIGGLAIDGIKFFCSEQSTIDFFRGIAHENCVIESILVGAESEGEVRSAEFGRMLTKVNGKLKEVTLLGTDSSETIAAIVKALADTKCTLTSVIFEDVGIDDTALSELVVAYKKGNLGVSNVAMCNCVLDGESITVLSEILTHPHSKIAGLDISFNEIGVLGCRHLAKAVLHECCGLTHLDLSNNALEDDGIEALCEEFEESTGPLKSLNISGNPFGIRGTQALTRALCTGKWKIGELTVDTNQIGNAGYSQLRSAAVQANCKLYVCTITADASPRDPDTI